MDYKAAIEKDSKGEIPCRKQRKSDRNEAFLHNKNLHGNRKKRDKKDG